MINLPLIFLLVRTTTLFINPDSITVLQLMLISWYKMKWLEDRIKNARKLDIHLILTCTPNVFLNYY